MKYERLRAEVVQVGDLPEMIYEPVRGVMVRGMEMPKSCGECRMYCRDYCRCYATEDGELVTDRNERPGWCQFVEVLN